MSHGELVCCTTLTTTLTHNIYRQIDTTRRIIVIKAGGACFVGQYNCAVQSRRISATPALIAGHTQPILDTAWSPFVSSKTSESCEALLATASGDATVKLWKLDQERIVHGADGVEILHKRLDTADLTFPSSSGSDHGDGHTKKVHMVQFHPSAEGVLCSASLDTTVKIWDVTTGQLRHTLTQHSDAVQNITWSTDGRHMATSCRDKLLRVFDPRSGDGAVVQGQACEGNKGFRVQWLGQTLGDRFLTVGFNKSGSRQFSVWDMRKGMKRGALTSAVIDQGPAPLMPFYDESTGLIYLAGRGDTVVKVYEEDWGQEPFVHHVHDFKSSSSHTGLFMLPKLGVDVTKFEQSRWLRLIGDSSIEFVTFSVPRKPILDDDGKPLFHEDIFPPVNACEPSLTAVAWFDGKDSEKKTKSLRPQGVKSIFEVDKSKIQSIDLHGSAETSLDSSEDFDVTTTNRIRSGTIQRLQRTESAVSLEKELSSRIQKGSLAAYLYKLNSDSIGKWKKRWFTLSLTSQCIYYGPSKGILSQKKKIPFSDIVSVEYCDNLSDTKSFGAKDGGKNRWFQINTLRRVFHLVAETVIECVMFVEAFHKNLQLSEDHIFEDQFLEVEVSSSGKVKGLKSRLLAVWRGQLLIFSHKKASLPLESLSFASGEIESLETCNTLTGLSPEERSLCLRLQLKSRRQIFLLATQEQQREDWVERVNMLVENAQNQVSGTRKGQRQQRQQQQQISKEERVLIQLGFLHEAANNASDGSSAQMKEPPGRVHVKPVSTNLKEEDIANLFGVFGTITEIDIHRSGKLKDSCFIAYERYSAAENATKLNQATLDTEIISVDIVTDDELNESAVIRVDGLSKAVSRLDFVSLFGPDVFGPVDMINLSYEDDRVVGFVKYASKESAEQALMLNGAKVFGQVISIKQLTSVTSQQEDSMFINQLDPTLLKDGRQKALIMVRAADRSTMRSRLCEFHPASFSPHDVFVLDAGAVVYQWNGRSTSRFARARGLDVSSAIRMKDRMGAAKFVVLDEEKQETEQRESDMRRHWETFMSHLGLKAQPSTGVSLGNTKLPVIREDRDLLDESFWEKLDTQSRLYRIALNNQQYKRSAQIMTGEKALMKPWQDIRVKIVHEGGPPSKDLLKSEYVYVLDTVTEVFVWEGMKVESKQRAFAKKFAAKLSQEESRPAWTMVTRLVQGAETTLFREKFYDWLSGMLPIAVTAGDSTQQAGNVAETIKQLSPEELSETMARQRRTPNAVEISGIEEKDGVMAASGNVVAVYRIEGFEKVACPENEFGQFWSGESYVVLYRYKKGNREKSIVYFWQGRDSSINEKGASALLSVEVFEDVSQIGEALQVRVLQQKESKHFLSVFPQGIVIHHGKKKKESSRDLRMFDCRAMDDEGGDAFPRLRAVELSHPDIAFLNSNHVSVIYNARSNKCFIWKGQHANPVELRLAENVARIVSGNAVKVSTISENKETNDFFSLFTASNASNTVSSSTYDQSRRMQLDIALYDFSLETGAVNVERVYSIMQNDLNDAHVMVLDCVDRVYVWFGAESAFKVRKIALETALHHVKVDKSKKRPRNAEQTVFVVESGKEPSEFKRVFQAWAAPSLRSQTMKRRRHTLTSDDDAGSLIPALQKLQSFSKQTFTYEQLLSDDLPDSVDRGKLEQYLDDDEFNAMFKMSRTEFGKLSEWKQKEAKRAVYLF